MIARQIRICSPEQKEQALKILKNNDFTVLRGEGPYCLIASSDKTLEQIDGEISNLLWKKNRIGFTRENFFEEV